MKHRRLQELDRSDFEIVKGEPDIRGWDVKNMNRQKIGEVEELILDAQEKKIRYMVVDLDDNELKLNHRKVLIPIGLAELDPKEDDVLIPHVSPQQLSQVPEYNRKELTPEVERRICSTLGRRMDSPRADEDRIREENRAKQERKMKEDQRINREARETTSPQNEPQPAKGKTASESRHETEKVDPDFYRHEYYNVDNLYKNRLHEVKPTKGKNESEYERGLRLWERRSEGGIIADDSKRRENAQPARDESGDRELDEETRTQMIRDRRNNYRQRRYGGETPRHDRKE